MQVGHCSVVKPWFVEEATDVDVQVVTVVAVAVKLLAESAYALKVRPNLAVEVCGVLPSNRVGV